MIDWRLHAGDRAEHQDGAVEHAQRALDLDGEVDVAGRVDDVDVVVLPLQWVAARRDRDAALALELHGVHRGADAVLALDLVDRVDPLGVEEDALGQRRLARVDVGADADVADRAQIFDHFIPLDGCRRYHLPRPSSHNSLKLRSRGGGGVYIQKRKSLFCSFHEIHAAPGHKRRSPRLAFPRSGGRIHNDGMPNRKPIDDAPAELEGRPDLELESLRTLGHRAVDWMVDYLSGLSLEVRANERPILPTEAPEDVFARFRAGVPEDGISPEQVFDEFRETILPLTTTLQHPGNLGYIPNSASIVGIIGDLVSSTLNQNVSIVRGGPSAAAVEHQVVGWLRELLGVPPGGGGILTSGGSLGNLMGIALARERAGNPERIRYYVSEETHSSIERAIKFLGLPRESMRYVETDDALRIRPDALEAAIEADVRDGANPAAVVAAAGTIGSGAVDDLEALGSLCERRGLWLHVDGAYGALAAAAPSCAWMRAGLARADSLSLDPHKWLFVPIDVSCLLVRDLDFMRQFFGVKAEYLRVVASETTGDVHQPMEHTVELSRRFRALKLWMVLKAFGARSMRAIIEEHLQLARTFAGWVEQDEEFELSAPVVTSTVCFRYRPSWLPGRGMSEQEEQGELDRVNEAMLHEVNRRPGLFISRNRLRGRFTLRACVTSLRTREVDLRRLWDACRSIAPTIQ